MGTNEFWGPEPEVVVWGVIQRSKTCWPLYIWQYLAHTDNVWYKFQLLARHE